MSFHGFQFIGVEITLCIELGDLTVQRCKSFAQLLRRCLSADRYRARVIERLVVDPHGLPQPAVDEPLLKLRAWIVEHVREHVRRVCGLRVQSNARSLPLHMNGYGTHRCLDHDAFTFLKRRNLWYGIRHEWISTARPRTELPLGK